MSNGPVVERRGVFVERLTYMVVTFAGFGGLLVMIDPTLTVLLPGEGNSLKIGGDGFSEQLKGAVIQTLLIGGWTTALAFWLRITPTEQRQQETVSRMAEAAAPNTSRAVAAARGPAPLEPVAPAAPAGSSVTAAPANPVTGNIPAAEVAPVSQPNEPEKPK